MRGRDENGKATASVHYTTKTIRCFSELGKVLLLTSDNNRAILIR